MVSATYLARQYAPTGMGTAARVGRPTASPQDKEYFCSRSCLLDIDADRRDRMKIIEHKAIPNRADSPGHQQRNASSTANAPSVPRTLEDYWRQLKINSDVRELHAAASPQGAWYVHSNSGTSTPTLTNNQGCCSRGTATEVNVRTRSSALPRSGRSYCSLCRRGRMPRARARQEHQGTSARTSKIPHKSFQQRRAKNTASPKDDT